MITSEEIPFARRDETRAAAGIDVSLAVDFVEVRRLARLAAEPNGLAGVLTERELKYCYSQRRPAEHIAARFAAKEAVLKPSAQAWERASAGPTSRS